ncbi:piggyBac transposable element-derived protein 4 [Trichonephila inaurata madagascariensis]|uniref:PiggyBac transposable element-derived protein 4 n=1 Tax=Trichonephila inaurata madagascariensis TaxID=2747483 RepID=A0A8X6K2E9_9ARAC|nr:piggyBac transposable element-derived protein 4 [Trichonephila inaurata madagascariensis]
MPVRKFISILGNIHLNDNNLMPKKSEKNFDKLYKVRPLLDHLSEMFFKVFKPGKKQAIDERKTKEVERNLGGRVRRNLSQKLLGKNHVLCFDNYFTSYDLLKDLETQNITACGTVNMSRKNLPKNLLEDKKMKRSDFDWSVNNADIACIKWKNKRIVHILATLDEATKSYEIERKEKDGKKLK